MIQDLVSHYGLVAVTLGAAIEGETAAIVGGLLARQHLLSVPASALASGLGSFVADQLFFLLGRHFRDHPRVQKWLDNPAAETALDALEKHPTSFVLGFRFLYGLRTISPIAAGTSDIPQIKFVALNAIAATVWAIVFTAVGYFAGGPILALFGPSHPFRSIIIAVVAIAVMIGIARLAWRKFGRKR